MKKREEFLKKIVEKKIVDQQTLDEAVKEAEFTKKSIEEILIEEKKIDSEELTKVKAGIYSMLYQNLLNVKVNYEVLNIISFESAENYKIVCFSKKNNKIFVGITDPDDFKAMEAVNFLAKDEGFEVEYCLISNSSFLKIFKQYKNLEKEISTALEVKAKEEAQDLAKIKKHDKVELNEVIKSAPVVKIVSVIIRHAVEGRASDIHIEPFKTESRIRYRIDGILHTSLILPKDVHNALVARIKVMANLKLDETRIPQDGRISLSFGNKEIDFRVSILPLVGEEKVVMRILDLTRGAPTLESLGYKARFSRIISDSIKKTNGMFLVTGPTGSGKSTTLFSVLNMLNKEGVNISTLEDPVEYFVKGANQSQIRPEIGFTFASGLRAILRQDPDIIMVGEIRDNETVELAIHASLTGHFVLSTLHTNDAIGAIPRLIDMKAEPFLIGSALNIVIAQRLVRRICPHCKKEEKLPSDILSSIEEEVKNIPEKIFKEEVKNFSSFKDVIFYKGEGCSRCGETGYVNRIAIAEVLVINQQIKDTIINRNKILRLEDIREKQDFITIKQDGILKVLNGETTMEEILRITRD